MPPHDARVRQPQRLRGAHIVHLPVAQKLGAHIVGQPHPAEQREQHQQQGQAGREHRRKNDQQIQLRHRSPDLHQPLYRQIDAPAEIALHGADEQAQQRARDGERQREQHRQPEAVDQPRQHVTPAIVGAQPMSRRGRRGKRPLREVIDGGGAVGNGGIEREISGGRQLGANVGVEIVGRRVEVAAKRGFGIAVQQRQIKPSVIAHQQRFVVADHGREQTQAEQQQKQPQAPAPQAMRLEPRPSLREKGMARGLRLRQRGGAHRSAPNWMRGSTQT